MFTGPCGWPSTCLHADKRTWVCTHTFNVSCEEAMLKPPVWQWWPNYIHTVHFSVAPSFMQQGRWRLRLQLVFKDIDVCVAPSQNSQSVVKFHLPQIQCMAWMWMVWVNAVCSKGCFPDWLLYGWKQHLPCQLPDTVKYCQIMSPTFADEHLWRIGKWKTNVLWLYATCISPVKLPCAAVLPFSPLWGKWPSSSYLEHLDTWQGHLSFSGFLITLLPFAGSDLPSQERYPEITIKPLPM